MFHTACAQEDIRGRAKVHEGEELGVGLCLRISLEAALSPSEVTESLVEVRVILADVPKASA